MIFLDYFGGTYTPPDPSDIGGIDANTVLMLHMDGTDESTTFTDDSDSEHTVTANGDAQIDTAQKKFGTGSGLFDGNGDYLSATLDSSPGTGDFCFDGWFRMSTVNTYNAPFELGTYASSNMVLLAYVSSGRIVVYVNASLVLDTLDGNTPLSANTWYHYAVARLSGTLYAYIDGALIKSGSNSSNITATNFSAGGRNSDGDYITGWSDEVRVSYGAARIDDSDDPLYCGGDPADGFTPPAYSYTDKR